MPHTGSFTEVVVFIVISPFSVSCWTTGVQMEAQRDSELSHSFEKEVQHAKVAVQVGGRQSPESTSPCDGHGILVHTGAAADVPFVLVPRDNALASVSLGECRHDARKLSLNTPGANAVAEIEVLQGILDLSQVGDKVGLRPDPGCVVGVPVAHHVAVRVNGNDVLAERPLDDRYDAGDRVAHEVRIVRDEQGRSVPLHEQEFLLVDVALFLEFGKESLPAAARRVQRADGRLHEFFERCITQHGDELRVGQQEAAVQRGSVEPGLEIVDRFVIPADSDLQQRLLALVPFAQGIAERSRRYRDHCSMSEVPGQIVRVERGSTAQPDRAGNLCPLTAAGSAPDTVRNRHGDWHDDGICEYEPLNALSQQGARSQRRYDSFEHVGIGMRRACWLPASAAWRFLVEDDSRPGPGGCGTSLNVTPWVVRRYLSWRESGCHGRHRGLLARTNALANLPSTSAAMRSASSPMETRNSRASAAV